MTRPTAWYAPDPGALLNGPFRLTGIDSAQPRLQLHILTLHIRAQNPTAYPLSVSTPTSRVRKLWSFLHYVATLAARNGSRLVDVDIMMAM